MRKEIPYIVFVLFLGLGSCLDPSETSLYEKGTSKIVIEARISDQKPPYYFRVSRSVNAENYRNSLPINNAVIMINDDKGNSEALSFIGQGIYKIDELQGTVGRSYKINADINGLLYQAIDSIRETPHIDSVKSEYINESNRKKGYYLVFYINDKNINKNYYKFEISVNDSLYNGYYDLLFVEDIPERTTQTWILPYKFNRNDTVISTVHSITKSMYEYYRGLNKQVENLYGNIQPPMLNPPNNIEGGLGYFQASSIWKDTTLIQ